MNTNNSVSVSRVVVKGIISMLSSKEGVDISPIANDLAKGGYDADLSALNIMLTLSHPELLQFTDTAQRTDAQNEIKSSKWGTGYRVYTFINYSTLLNKVHYSVRCYDFYDNGVRVRKESEDYMDSNNWAQLNTNIPEALLKWCGEEEGTYTTENKEEAE